MDFTDFRTGKDDEGRRLDKVIRIFIPDLPLSNIYQAMRKGLVKVNGKKSKPDYRIISGDVLSVADILLKDDFSSSIAESKVPELSSSLPQIESLIVFENKHILIFTINICPFKLPSAAWKENISISILYSCSIICCPAGAACCSVSLSINLVTYI